MMKIVTGKTFASIVSLFFVVTFAFGDVQVKIFFLVWLPTNSYDTHYNNNFQCITLGCHVCYMILHKILNARVHIIFLYNLPIFICKVDLDVFYILIRNKYIECMIN